MSLYEAALPELLDGFAAGELDAYFTREGWSDGLDRAADCFAATAVVWTTDDCATDKVKE